MFARDVGGQGHDADVGRAQVPGLALRPPRHEDVVDPGEGDLPKPSVAVVSQLFTVDKSQLSELIGTVSKKRLRQILDGVKLLIEPREIE